MATQTKPLTNIAIPSDIHAQVADLPSAYSLQLTRTIAELRNISEAAANDLVYNSNDLDELQLVACWLQGYHAGAFAPKQPNFDPTVKNTIDI